MSYTFKGLIKNDYRPELGTNITIKELEKDKVILQATKELEFEKATALRDKIKELKKHMVFNL